MFHSNSIEFEIHGRNAMFTDPAGRAEGRLCSYPVPTYEAVKGILRAIYWKPTFVWVPDEIRIMNRIATESYPVKLRRQSSCVIAEEERLTDFRCQVRAHFVWNYNRPEYTADRNEDKHFRIALRHLSRGGRFGIYLGTADCPGYVSPAFWGRGSGHYDNSGVIDLGEMYHGMTYPDEGWDSATRSGIYRRKWHCVMENGVIRFALPEQCSAEFVRSAEIKRFGENKAMTGV